MIRRVDLLDESKKILAALYCHPKGVGIRKPDTSGGNIIIIGEKFAELGQCWDDAFEEILNLDLIKIKGHSIELTDKGRKVSEMLKYQ